MASADFWQFTPFISDRIAASILFAAFCQTSAGKHVNFPLIHLLHLPIQPRIALDFVLFSKLVQLG
jgi:hypothetical protein